jgi:hypothetical protein
VLDNRPEFTSKAMLCWAEETGTLIIHGITFGEGIPCWLGELNIAMENTATACWWFFPEKLRRRKRRIGTLYWSACAGSPSSDFQFCNQAVCKTPWQTFQDSKHLALEKDLSRGGGRSDTTNRGELSDSDNFPLSD